MYIVFFDITLSCSMIQHGYDNFVYQLLNTMQLILQRTNMNYRYYVKYVLG